MSSDKTGGSAYPVLTPDMNLGDTAGPGMTLRDYFAGQALAGMCASKIAERNKSPKMATMSYMLADAMIKEREEPQ